MIKSNDKMGGMWALQLKDFRRTFGFSAGEHVNSLSCGSNVCFSVERGG